VSQNVINEASKERVHQTQHMRRNICSMNRGSSVGIATSLRAERPWFDSRQRHGFLFFVNGSRPALKPTQPSIQWALSPGVKRPVRKAEYAPPLLPSLRIRGAIPPLPQYVFSSWFLIKQRMRLHGVVLS
jgi:hypothetical protein